MQGLPIQNLIKGANLSKENLKAKPHVNGQSASSEIDFSSLFEGLKNNGEEVKGIEIKNPEGKSETSVEIAKASSNIDQLLNGLKGTVDDEESEDAKEGIKNLNTTKKNFFINNKEKSGNGVKDSSPLDFLVKGMKERDLSGVSPESLESVKAQGIDLKESEISKKPFFANTAKIQNPVQLTKAADLKNENIKLVSGEDFVDSKSALAEGKISNKEQKAQTKNIDQVIDLNKFRNQLGQKENSLIRGYDKGQNILNDSMIRSTKDLAFKDQKKTKSEIQELLTPESKVGAHLSAIKEDMIAPMNNSKNNQNPFEAEVQKNQKVLDLSHINTSNTNEIIKKISDYVAQNQVAGKDSLDLSVKHESLGEFKITVTKVPNPASNQIDMQITTASKDGHDFFVKNETGLLKNLNQAGINLSDFKIVSTMSESTPFSSFEGRQQSSFQHNQDGSNSKQFMSFESNDFSNGRERRKELWQEYQQRYGA